MEINLKERDDNLKPIFNLAMKGLFLFFDSSWTSELSSTELQKKFTQNEKAKIKKILKRISFHKSIDRQKSILLSLAKEERILFFKHIMKVVETKTLDSNPHLH